MVSSYECVVRDCFLRCYLKLGDWQEHYGIDENSIPDVIHYYELATKHDKQWYVPAGNQVLPNIGMYLQV